MFYTEGDSRANRALEAWRSAWSGDLARQLAGVAAVLSALMAGAAIVVVTTQAQGIELGILLRDPATSYGFPPYAGFFSHLGILAVAAAAAICFFAAVLAAGRARTVLRLGGCLSALLVLDDIFLLHEGPLRLATGLPETVPFALYATLALLLLAAMGRDSLAPGAALLWLCFGFLGLSVLLDLTQWGGRWSMLSEDMAKLCGFVVWVMFWAGYARRGIAPRRDQAPV